MNGLNPGLPLVYKQQAHTRFLFIALLFFINTAFAPRYEIAPITPKTSYDWSELPAFLRPKPEPAKNKTSLQEALNPDGTLKAGMEGSFDTKGFNMTYGANGQPIFKPFGAGDERWQSIPNLTQGVNGVVYAIAITSSELVYVGGEFTEAGGIAANNIAMWDGSGWTTFGTGTNGEVKAIEISGTNVIVGGSFTNINGVSANRIAVWNGSSWAALGSGLAGTANSISVSGTSIFVGGTFITAGGVTVNRIARWNGSAWNALGTGVNGSVETMTINGSSVFVGGSFTFAGGISANRIAVWNGTAWSALGSGLNGAVYASSSISGNLVVGGEFTTAGGISANGIARWNGTSWNAIGTGVNGTVASITGSGLDNILIGGNFNTAGGSAVNNLALWNGSTWSSYGKGFNGSVLSLETSQANGIIYAGGAYTQNGDSSVRLESICILNGSSTAPLAFGSDLFGEVLAVAVSSSDIYIAGSFTRVNGLLVNRIAKWNGTSWSALGTGFNDTVNKLVLSGSILYAGGDFSTAGGIASNRIAVWNGASWSALGSGVNGSIHSMILNGTNLIVGGEFSTAGGVSVKNIAQWNGSAWTALGTGIEGVVFALSASGGVIFVGGSFSDAGGVAANNIARWNGTNWSSLGGGVNGSVFDILSEGITLYVGGNFNLAGVITANNIALWNGTSWNALGTGVNGRVRSITKSGVNVYVGGDFTLAGGLNASKIAVWNSQSWLTLGTGLSGNVADLEILGTRLIVGGGFFGSSDYSVTAQGIIIRDGLLPNAALQSPITLADPKFVRLNGIVNSRGLTGTYYFEYGLTSTNLNTQSTVTNMSGSSDIAVNAEISSSTPGATYFYRLRVENVEGISYSPIQSYVFPSDIEVRQNVTTLTSGSEFDFGSINYLSSSVAIPFSVNNLGLGNLTISGTAGNLIVKGGAHPGDFVVVQSGVTSTISFNGSQNFTVQFNPQSGGVRTATLTITSNDPDEPSYVINLKGTGVRLNQTITFNALAVRTMGEAPFALSGTSTSGLPVSYSSATPGVATISGNTVTLVGPGTTVITASQAGDGNYNAATSVPQTLTVRAAEPVAQPTALTFNTITSNSMNGAFTAATGSPTGYIVLRREGSAVADQPVDGTTYSAGATSGSTTIISIGSGTTFSSTGLSSGATYHYAVFAYNGSGVTINYRQASPLQNSQATIVSEPTSQATTISFSNLNPTTLTVNWNNGNGTERLVIARQASAVSIDPTDGVVYTGNTNFATATDLGSGNKVVFRGSGNSVTVTNLLANTVYHFRVYELNGTGTQSNYLTTTAMNNPTSRTTLQTEPTAQPTALIFNNITVSSLGGSFTAASGSPAGYLILRRAGSAPTFTPADGTAYSSGAQGDAFVVASGSATTFEDAGLVAGTTYHYAIYAFNGAGQSINYRTVSALASSTITVSPAPTANAASNVNQTSFQANWSAVTGAASYSLDVSSDNFSNLITGYAAKSITGLNDAVTGLTPGTTYQYRVRAVNASGLSANSNTITQITIPQTPTTAAAQQILSTEFKAVWNQSPGATGYQLDVSRDNNFNTFENNYQNRSISGASTTELVVTGMSPTTQYFYRVRSVNAGGISPNSNVINVTTLSAAGALTVGNPSFTNSATASISITLSNGSGSRIVKFYSRGILESAFRAPVTLTSTSNTYTTTLTPSLLDEMGIEFYFTAEDASTPTPIRSPEIGNSYIYTPVPANTNIPGLSFGGELKNYRIISIPYALNTNNTPIVFSPLGAYDKTKWRLLQLSGTAYADNPGTITPGRGYWFNARQSTIIELGEGTVVKNNQTTPFTMQLQQGWNMIATPFPFAIDWDDVRVANPTAQLDPEYFVFNPSTIGYSMSNSLKPFEGGFVYAETATSLTIPVLLKNTSGGRKQNIEVFEKNLDAINWHLPIRLRQGEVENSLGAVGMHEEAKPGKDRFDRVVLPAFLNYVQLTTQHPDAHVPDFIRDVVPPQKTYVWNFALEASSSGPIELQWDADAIKHNQAQLLLYDQAQGSLIDMRSIGTYTTTAGDDKKIQIIYTQKEHTDLIREIGKPYPNPFSTTVKLPGYFNANGESTRISVSIVSLTGTEVYQHNYISTEKGLHQPHWNGETTQGETITSGLYIFKVIYNNDTTTLSHQGKILKQ